ncbi:MAG: radical SAM protein [Bdellovibrionaceae bacterium]|nr:radical SAM protein [Pseudobdellovibrionaceae bacterium]
MNLSLNPSYRCNFRCSFCYLTKTQLSDPQRLDVKQLERKLTEIETFYGHGVIQHVDLYGGEIALLPENYLLEIIEVLKGYARPPFNLITNFSSLHPIFHHPQIEVSVSFDYMAREKWQQVFRNLTLFEKSFSILVLASRRVLEQSAEELIEVLNSLSQLVSVEIKPYSVNQANQDLVSHLDYERYILRWMELRSKMRFHFVNAEKISRSLAGKYNAFSNDHLYITPQGHFAVLDFDSQDREYFRVIQDLTEFQKWCIEEEKKIRANPFCSRCDFLGGCLTEHYREVRTLSEGCSGYLGLLQEFRSRREKLL